MLPSVKKSSFKVSLNNRALVCWGWKFLAFSVVVTCVCCPLQVNRCDLTRKEREMWNINLQGVIHLIVIIVVDILFHFMYILTIPTDLKLMKHLSDWALGLCHFSKIHVLIFLIPTACKKSTNEDWPLTYNWKLWLYAIKKLTWNICSFNFNYLRWKETCSRTDVTALFPVGLAYFNLVYDWVKAAVMFGVINTVSRLDHLDPPKPPKCITMLYVFAETWVRLVHMWLVPGVHTV